LLQDSSTSKEFAIPLSIPEHTDVKISAKGSGAASIFGCYEGWYETD